MPHTLLRCRIEDVEVKVVRFTHVVREDDLALEVEDADTRAVESDARLIFARRKAVKD